MIWLTVIFIEFWVTFLRSLSFIKKGQISTFKIKMQILFIGNIANISATRWKSSTSTWVLQCFRFKQVKNDELLYIILRL
jgi:hypothetical protein